MTSDVEISGIARTSRSGINGRLHAALLLASGLALVLPVIGCKQSSAPPPTEPSANATSVAPAPAAPAPFVKRHIYSETANPRTEIADAIKQAAREHKRVIVDFGGDWCGDCQLLEIYFRQVPNEELLSNNFVVAHVFVNHEIDNNLDLGEKYGIPLKKGVPALAVLDAHGKLLYSQKTGEFENMRRLDAQAVTDFLNHWKA